jgi:hypothetical protein
VRLGFRGLFGAGLRFGFGEVVAWGWEMDGVSLVVRCLLLFSLHVLGVTGVREAYLAVEIGKCSISCCA